MKMHTREELNEILRNNKGTRHDVISGLSGGKDSLFLLHQLAEVLSCRVKAFTWDHYHTMPAALTAARNAVYDLGNVDWSVFGYQSKISRAFTSAWFQVAQRFCICPHWMMLRALPDALDNEIPLIAIGYSPDQNEPKGEWNFIADRDARIHALKNYVYAFRDLTQHCLEKCYPQEAESYLDYLFGPICERLAQTDRYQTIPAMLNLSMFVEWNAKDIQELIYEKKKWKTSGRERLHSNCLYEPIRGYLECMKGRTFLEDEAEYLFKTGQLTREEADVALKSMHYSKSEPEVLSHFCRHIGVANEDFRRVIEEEMAPETMKLVDRFVSTLFVFQGFQPAKAVK